MGALDPAVPALPEHEAMLVPRVAERSRQRLVGERPAAVRVVEVVLA